MDEKLARSFKSSMVKMSEDGVNELKLKMFKKNMSNVNNLSYWFLKVKDCGIKVPETVIVPLDFNMFKWLMSDNYVEEDIQKLGSLIQGKLEQSSLKDKQKLFIKNGTFSNKFQFNTCRVDNISNIGTNFLNVSYASMCVGAGNSTEVVLREFIESDPSIQTIYDGMPLNTEFRVFYDFDNGKVLGVFNYWDRDTMLSSLKYDCFKHDLEVFLASYTNIEENFNRYKDTVTALVASSMASVNLTGSWSVDIMMVNNEYYLIDMATAQTSYYYNKLSH